MSDPEQEPKTVRLPEDLRPTQAQLEHLRDTVFSHEPKIELFDGLPPREVLDEFDTDLTDFEILAGPPRYDETLAPSCTLRAPDKRVLWLSVFRNPDTNQYVRQHLMVIDPPINRSLRPEIPREDYDITESNLGKVAIERFNSPPMTSLEVEALQELVDSSIPFNAFLEIGD